MAAPRAEKFVAQSIDHETFCPAVLSRWLEIFNWRQPMSPEEYSAIKRVRVSDKKNGEGVNSADISTGFAKI